MTQQQPDWKALQLEWDRFLVFAFYKQSGRPASQIKAWFRKEYAPEVSWEDLAENLKRWPCTPWHSKPSFSRFVAAYLPTISKVLFNYTYEDVDRLTAAINKLQSTARMKEIDHLQASRERGRIKRSMAHEARAKMEKDAVKDHYKSRRLTSQWTTVK